MEASTDQRNQVLKALAEETVKTREEDKKKADGKKDNAITSKGSVKEDKPVYFFQLIRELTLLGYFTSEAGATKALAYVQVPGRYDGCVDMKPGQKAWAI